MTTEGQIYYQVNKHYRKNGFFEFDTLFESTNKTEAENFFQKLPKSNKRTQFRLQGFHKTYLSPEDVLMAQINHDRIWANSTFGE